MTLRLEIRDWSPTNLQSLISHKSFAVKLFIVKLRLLPLCWLLLMVVACRRSPPASTPPSPRTPTQVATAVATTTAVYAPPSTATPTPMPTTIATAIPQPTPISQTPSPFTPDQSSEAFRGALWGLAALAPIGQTFVPAQDALDMVVLWVAVNGSQDAALQVAVHEGRLDGRILGRSLPIPLPAGFEGQMQFRFETPVPLQPGQVYTLELLPVGGEGTAVGWVQHAGWDDPYPKGSAIVQGQSQPNADLWFEEGLEIRD